MLDDSFKPASDRKLLALILFGISSQTLYADPPDPDGKKSDGRFSVSSWRNAVIDSRQAAADFVHPTPMQLALHEDTRVTDEFGEATSELTVYANSLPDQIRLPDWLLLAGSHRTRYEYMNGQFRQGLRSIDQQLSHRTRLLIAIQERLDPLRFTIELQDSRVHLNEADSNVNTGHVNQFDIQQLHIDFHFKRIFDLDLPAEIQLGRVNMDLGRGRWIARNNFRNATNAYDGVYWKAGSPDDFESNAFAVWPVDRKMRALDPALGNNDNFLWGTYLLLPPAERLPWLRAELDYIGHSSRTGDRDFHMFGYRLFKPSRTRQFGFEIESQYQFHSRASARRFAHVHHSEIDYTFDAKWNPQFQLKFDYASPDVDLLYGRRMFEFEPTGIIGPFQRSNLLTAAYRLLVHPLDQFMASFQHRLTWLADPKTPWINTGLSDPDGRSGSFLGHTYELRMNWHVHQNVILQAGYMFFNFGKYPRNAPDAPGDRNTHYTYFSTEVLF